MNVRKFFAATARQALQQVRQGLGPDALILSNRSVNDGVEILAIGRDELPGEEAAPQATGRKAARATSAPAAPPAPQAAKEAPEPSAIGQLRSELLSMRGLLEEQFAYQKWDSAQQREPEKATILRDMLRAGFSPALTRQLLDKMPAGLDGQGKREWVRSVLDRNLFTVDSGEEIVERGGVYALVGPTGVGKTTTVAKIAARCVVRHGTESLALLTTDGYRIGAHEQLRIYGKLLGVRVLAIKDVSDLKFMLEDLRAKHLVLIDTVGMSQRDRMVSEQLELLGASGAKVESLLLLNAAGNGETLEDVVRVYGGGAGGEGKCAGERALRGCIITKTDEAVGIATAIDVAIRHRLAIHYVTNGQRVPEDLHLPARDYLLHRALRQAPKSAVHDLEDSDCRLLLGSAPGSAGFAQGGACLA